MPCSCLLISLCFLGSSSRDLRSTLLSAPPNIPAQRSAPSCRRPGHAQVVPGLVPLRRLAPRRRRCVVFLRVWAALTGRPFCGVVLLASRWCWLLLGCRLVRWRVLLVASRCMTRSTWSLHPLPDPCPVWFDLCSRRHRPGARGHALPRPGQHPQDVHVPPHAEPPHPVNGSAAPPTLRFADHRAAPFSRFASRVPSGGKRALSWRRTK